MAVEDVYISHVVGRCPIDGMQILDNGKSDDPDEWEHSWAQLQLFQDI